MNVTKLGITMICLIELALLAWVGFHLGSAHMFSLMWLVLAAAGITVSWFRYNAEPTHDTTHNNTVVALLVTVGALIIAAGWIVKGG